jgi:hypothetical protein
MKRKNNTLITVLVFAFTLIFALTIFNDWDNFKRGLMDAPPIENVDIEP